MSRKNDLAALGKEISDAQVLAIKLELSMVAHLLAMAHLDLIEQETEYDVIQPMLSASGGQ